MYDESIGQFMQADPIGFEAGDANLRRYVRNNATNATDPSGMQEKEGMIRAAERRQIAQAKEKQATSISRKNDIIDGLALSADEKKRIRRSIQRLLDAAKFKWQHDIGPFGSCKDWVRNYWDEELKGLADELNDMRGYFQVSEVYWEVGGIVGGAVERLSRVNPFGGEPAPPGHAAVQITFVDGSIMYVDDGHLGGLSHIFFKDDIPSSYQPRAGFPDPPPMFAMDEFRKGYRIAAEAKTSENPAASYLRARKALERGLSMRGKGGGVSEETYDAAEEGLKLVKQLEQTALEEKRLREQQKK